MANVKKNKSVKVKTKTGGEYSYNYTDLASINNYLEINKIEYYQYIESTEYGDYIFTVVIQDGVEKAPRRGCKVINASTTSGGNVAQDYGAILTYCRRYSLLMALGLATDDNEANELTDGSYEINDKTKILTKEEAENYVITFGKYKNKTLKQIKNIDIDYLEWLVYGEKTDETIKQAIRLLDEFNPNLIDGEDNKIKLLTEFNEVLDKSESDLEEVLNFYQVESNADMTNEQLKQAITHMSKKIKSENMKEVF